MRINYVAVIVAAVVHFVIGGLWYGLIFANIFVDIVGREQLEKMAADSHWSQYLIAFISSLVLVYILAHFVQFTGSRTVAGGLQTAFWLWLGFVATTQLSGVIFEQRRLGLYLLNIGYHLVACLICGALLAVWQPKPAGQAAVEAA
jgi:hypothetical protein